MRFLKILLALLAAALAATAGVFVVALAVVVIAAFFLTRWIARSFGLGSRPPAATLPTSPAPRTPRTPDDVIEVTATEVPAPSSEPRLS